MKTWVPLNMNATVCFVLRKLVCTGLFVCVCVCVCFPFVIRVPKREGDIVKNQCSSKWALRGNPPQRFNEQLKSQRISSAAHYCTSIYSLSLVYRGGRSTGGWWGGGGGVPYHNFPWVMNCEMQQKPPLPQEGFRAHRAIEGKSV